VFLKDKGNAQTFITLEDIELRDRWLKVSLGVKLFKITV
jgi:hypothetical protein